MGNGARAHNHFCVMQKVDPRFASRHPANPAGNVSTCRAIFSLLVFSRILKDVAQ